MGHRHILAVPLLGQRCPASPAMTAFLNTLLGLVVKSGLPRENAEAWLLVLRDYVIGALVGDYSLHTLSSEVTSSNSGSARFVLSAGARDKMFKMGFDAMLNAIEGECGSSRT